MKIEGPTAVKPNTPLRRAASTGQGAVFVLPTLGGAQGPGAAQAMAATASLTGLDALMALQQFDEAGERRKRAAKRATGLLDTLDSLRVALLSGQPPEATAKHLATMLQEHRDVVDDDRLTGLLDEIDLRAQVELAKLERITR